MTSSFILHVMTTFVASRCSIGLARMIQSGEDYPRKEKVGKCVLLCQEEVWLSDI